MKITKYLLPMLVASTLMTGVAGAQTDPDTGVQPQTRVEVKNEAPAANPPQAPAPNIDIDMPDAPDVNVQAPAGGTNTTRETYTERTDRVIMDDTDDTDVTDSGNVWMMVLFGVIALFVVGLIAMAASRRSVSDV